MPQRTNEFQELVSLIQKALAGKNAKVTDSAMVDVPGMDEPREIDILIESEVGPFNIKIAVEAKNEGRKMDQTKFESIIGKYQSEGGVKVDKVVVVTHRGFYEPVIKRAEKLGIELMTLSQAKATEWAKIYPKAINFRIAPHICNIGIEPAISGHDPKDLYRKGRVVCCHGTDKGTPYEYAAKEVRNYLRQRPTLFDELHEKAKMESNGQAIANISFVPDHEHVIQFDENTYPIDKFSFGIHVVDDSADLKYTLCELAPAKGDKLEIPLGEAIVGGKRIRFVLPDGLKSKTIALNIASAPKSTDESV